MNKKEIVQNLEDELSGLADSFGDYVNQAISKKEIMLDDETVEDPVDETDVTDEDPVDETDVTDEDPVDETDE